LDAKLDCFGVPELQLRRFEDRVAFHQSFKSAGIDDVDQLIKGIAEGNQPVVTKEFWIRGIFADQNDPCLEAYIRSVQ